jgi:C4-dicarboxylate-binding protein DctP
MRRYVAFVLALIFVCVFLLARDHGQHAWAAAEKTVYTFKYGHTQSPKHPRSKSMEFFKEKLEKASNGRIKVEMYFSGTLGKEAEVMDMVKTGVVQGTRGGLWERANKKFLMYALPFLFENPQQAATAMKSDIGKDINRAALQNRFYVPACGVAGGARQITNNVRPINTIDDLKGLKIRTPPIDVIVRSFKAFGANPQQVAYTETYMALKTGVVDGQENPFSNITDMKFYEPQKYLSVVNWEVHPDPLFVNPDWYNSLPEDLKAIFDTVAEATLEYSNELWLSSEKDYRIFLEKKIKINDVPKENLRGFVEAGMEVYQYYVDKGYFTWSEINQVRRIAGLEPVK